MDTQTQIANSKDHINMLHKSMSKMKDITERMVFRSTSYASDMVQFGRELRYAFFLSSWFINLPSTQS